MATFAGTQTPSSVEIAALGVSANAGLAFKSAGYTLTGGMLTLGGAAAANTITTDADVVASINSDISASNGFTKAGAGTLALGGTVNGNITLAAGQLILGGVATGNATLTAGTLQVGNGGTAGALTGNLATPTGTTTAAVVFDRSDDSTCAGVITGNAALDKRGAGTLTLSGTSSTYAGPVAVSAGTLAVTNGAALGNATGGTTVASGATLHLAGVSVSDALTLSGDGVGGTAGALHVSGMNVNSSAGNVTLNAASTIATESGSGLTLGAVTGAGQALSVINGGTTTLASLAIGSATLNKNGGGTLAITGASTTGAMTVASGAVTVGGNTSAGTVSVNSGSLALNGSTNTLGSITVNGGSLAVTGTTTAANITVAGGPATLNGTVSANTLDVSGGQIVNVGGNTTVTGLNGAGTVRGGAAAGTFTVNKSSGSTSTFDGTLSDGASSLAVRHVGAGTTVLTNANSYSGGTHITDGTVEARANSALGSGDVTLTRGTLRGTSGTTIANNLVVAATTGTASLVSGYDFQTTTNQGTAAAVSPATPTSFKANFGGGTLYLNGSNGASSFFQSTELDAFAGSAGNTENTSFSVSTTGAASLAIKGGTSQSANGKSAVFVVNDVAGFSGFNVSYSTRWSGGSGFDSQSWAYSFDGTSYTALQTIGALTDTFTTKTLSQFNNPLGLSTLYLKLTVNGATASTGNNRFDNIKIEGLAAGTPSVIGSVAGSGTTTYTGTVSLAGNVNLDSASGSTVAFTNSISSGTGSRVITKTGTGKVTLAGPSTYNGSTVVSVGELRINNGTNGSGTGSSKVTVASGATLGGNGTIGNGDSASNAVTISRGAKVTAGTDGNHVGTLASGYQKWVGGPAVNGVVTGGTYEWKYANETGGKAWDRLQMSTLDLSDVSATNKFTILINKLSGNFTAGSYTILTADHIVGLPASIADSFVLDTSGLNLGGGDQAATLMFVAGSGDGGSFVVQAAPEPTTAALFALGGAAFLGRRRRGHGEAKTLFGFLRAKPGPLAN